MHPILPKIESVSLSGFAPIFTTPLSFSIDQKFFILLGGNGLGKTTTLQALVYGVAGSANTNIEQFDNKKRWDHTYFQKRLDAPNSAFIEVTLRFGEDQIKLKRGFKSDQILELSYNNEVLSSNKKETTDFFEQYLVENAGYNNIKEFNFLFHKLCYLSENRENLIWNTESQTRVLMHLFSDTENEEYFRDQRATLKKLDSEIRHLTVSINKTKKHVESLKATPIEQQSNLPKAEVNTSSNVDEQIRATQQKLLAVYEDVRKKEQNLRTSKEQFSTLNLEIEKLRQTITEWEDKALLHHIQHLEDNEENLGLHALLHYKTCPSCGNHSNSLYEQALEHLKNNSCPLCGTEGSSDISSIQPETEAMLNEKTKRKIELEEAIIKIEGELTELLGNSHELNRHFNKLSLESAPKVVYVNKQVDDPKIQLENYQVALEEYLTHRDKVQIQFNKLQRELSDRYTAFQNVNNERVDRLGKIYTRYATDFLGIECSLDKITGDAKFLDLHLFVPKFEGKVRDEPSSCSEAQRFFLDIAFRMAVIDLQSEMTGEPGTFVCETPENALDISYINNVTEMCYKFSEEGRNYLVLSCNIQPYGLAETALVRIKDDKKRKNHFLNMIKIGHLSEVQSSDYGSQVFQEVLDRISNGGDE